MPAASRGHSTATVSMRMSFSPTASTSVRNDHSRARAILERRRWYGPHQKLGGIVVGHLLLLERGGLRLAHQTLAVNRDADAGPHAGTHTPAGQPRTDRDRRRRPFSVHAAGFDLRLERGSLPVLPRHRAVGRNAGGRAHT